MRVVAVLALSYVLLAAAVLSDLFHLGPNSILFRSFFLGLPLLVGAVYLPDWALIIVSVVVVPTGIGYAVWHNSAGSDVAVLDARLLDLYPLLVLTLLAFALSAATEGRRRRAEKRERLARVTRSLEGKATRDDVAEEILAIGMPQLGMPIGVVWLADDLGPDLRVVADRGLHPGLRATTAVVPLDGFGLPDPTTDAPWTFVDPPNDLPERAPPRLLLTGEGTRLAYLQPLLAQDRLVGLAVFLRESTRLVPRSAQEAFREVARVGAAILTSRPPRPVSSLIRVYRNPS